jgi:hypothetical protein
MELMINGPGKIGFEHTTISTPYVGSPGADNGWSLNGQLSDASMLVLRERWEICLTFFSLAASWCRGAMNLWYRLLGNAIHAVQRVLVIQASKSQQKVLCCQIRGSRLLKCNTGIKCLEWTHGKTVAPIWTVKSENTLKPLLLKPFLLEHTLYCLC